MQPDVYCRRLGLQVPVAVSVKTGQMADVFHAICSVAMNPYVLCAPYMLQNPHVCACLPRNSAIPGGSDRALTATARIRMYIKVATMLGGIATGVVLVYRTFARPGSSFSSVTAQWINWIVGTASRREL